MSENIDPKILFDLIAHHLPTELHRHVLIAGSLAAAYHHRDQLIGGVINTKDADVVIQPAGAVAECERVARLLLTQGWRRTDACFARATPNPTDASPPDDWLRAIRLLPKDSDAYLNMLDWTTENLPDLTTRERRIRAILGAGPKAAAG